MKTALMEWCGYLLSIAGLMDILLTFDRPGWTSLAAGALLMLVGILLIYRSHRVRRSDDGDHGPCYSIEDDVADVMNGDD